MNLNATYNSKYRKGFSPLNPYTPIPLYLVSQPYTPIPLYLYTLIPIS